MIAVTLGGALIMAVKFIAYYYTRSNAILSDALESIINVTAGAFALFSLWFSSQPRDKDHPYGHGKIEFFSAGFEGGLIFIAGIVIFGQAGFSLFRPHALVNLDFGAWLTAGAGAANAIMGGLLLHYGKKNNSVVLAADGKHLLADTASSVGLVAGLIIVYITELYWLDNVLAMAFGFVTLYTGYKLLRSSVGSLLDEADYKKLEELIGILSRNRRHNWIDVHNLRMQKYGSSLHVDAHVTLPWYMTLEESHHEIKVMEDIVSREMSEPIEFFIHTDPCVPPASCTICQIEDCKVRQAAFVKKIDWKLENTLSNKKHDSTQI
jgi:cation diffusion facilitator family transporter